MSPADRQRLAAILGMLGSDHAGERAAAALQAEAFRRNHRLTWPELLALPPVEAMPEPEPEPPPPRPPERPAWVPPEPSQAGEWHHLYRPKRSIGMTCWLAFFGVLLVGTAIEPIVRLFH